MSYTYVSSSDLDPDFDLNLDVLNVRVDSTTNNVQISMTNSSYTSNFYYSSKLYDINTTGFYSLCDSVSSVSTTPVSLPRTTVDSLGKFVEIQLINLTNPRTYSIHVACVDSTPLFYITIAKVG